MEKKLNVVLAHTEQTAKSFKKFLSETRDFFKGKQGAFRGEKNTYVPKEGMIDEPTKRGNTLIQTTVDEKLQWLEETFGEHVSNVMSLEATNASGNARADLVVGGVSWGNFSSLELLRLKSMIESSEIKEMYENLPVRSDAEEWSPSQNEMYLNRAGIFESPLSSGVAKTTEKKEVILEDPNISKMKEGAIYTPQKSAITTTVEVGDYSRQKFSGEWSQRQRAELLRRRELLIVAIIEALKVANETPVLKSGITAEKIFGYLHGTAE